MTSISQITAIPRNAKWSQIGVSVAGGQSGSEWNQLSDPCGLCVDEDNIMYICDNENHRILSWKLGEENGTLVAGGNGKGDRDDQLNHPTDLILDKGSDSIIISDLGNNRVVRWSLWDGKKGETIISNIACCGLTMDSERSLYASDVERAEVRKYRIGEKSGIVVAGGNREGNRLNQLNCPTYIFVDQKQSVYVSDRNNDRVVKWSKGAKEGAIVAGRQDPVNISTQMSSPEGILVDEHGNLYVAEFWNHRVTCWKNGKKGGEILLGGNGKGKRADQLNGPMGISFDNQGNLYIADRLADRIQRFGILK